jgi:hypothetical protein
MRTRLLSLSFVLFAAACGGGGGNPDAAPHVDSHPAIDAPGTADAPEAPDADLTPDADTTPDANLHTDAAVVDADLTPDAILADGGPLPDAVVTACLADPAGYGTPTLANQGGYDAGDGSLYAAYGGLNADVDAFEIALYAGYGVFGAGAVTPGTYDIALDEPSLATCGACGLVLADNATTVTDPNGVYFAASGTVTITSLGPDVTGSVDNLVLNHVTVDGSTGDTTIVGDCQTTITHADFDGPIAPALVGGRLRLRLRDAVHHHH